MLDKVKEKKTCFKILGTLHSLEIAKKKNQGDEWYQRE